MAACVEQRTEFAGFSAKWELSLLDISSLLMWLDVLSIELSLLESQCGRGWIMCVEIRRQLSLLESQILWSWLDYVCWDTQTIELAGIPDFVVMAGLCVLRYPDNWACWNPRFCGHGWILCPELSRQFSRDEWICGVWSRYNDSHLDMVQASSRGLAAFTFSIPFMVCSLLLFEFYTRTSFIHNDRLGCETLCIHAL